MHLTHLQELLKDSKTRTLGSLFINWKYVGNFRNKTWKDELLCFNERLTSLDGSPKRIEGDFICHSNLLETLEGGPVYVEGSYNAYNNRLKSLVGAPLSVDIDFYCESNKLTSIDCSIDYMRDFSCENNKITSLHDIHKHIREINGVARFKGNPIKSHILGLLKIKSLRKVFFDKADLSFIINKYLPEGDLLDCQEELIEAGFEEYAQL